MCCGLLVVVVVRPGRESVLRPVVWPLRERESEV